MAETHEHGQVIQRLQDLETAAVKQLDRVLSKVQNGMALRWTKRMRKVVDARVLVKLDKWTGSRGGMAPTGLS